MSLDRRPLSRRALLRLGAGAVLMPGALRAQTAANAPSAAADEAGRSQAGAPRHGMSFFGDLAYPPDFPHFAYVNPAAPKGGTFSQIGSRTFYNQALYTFDTLNPYNHRGNGAQGIELIYDTLMASAGDELSALYARLAASVRIEDEGRIYRFALHPKARFHDGTPVTSADVVATFKVLKADGYETIRMALKDLQEVEADGPGQVVMRFSAQRGRDAPLTAASLPIFAKAYLDAHPFGQSTLDPPLGSGPYRIARFEQGRYIEYARVKDYWGAGLPTMKGRYNFDLVRYDYFRDRTAGLEAFKARVYLFREEFTSRDWATAYDFPAARDGRVKLDTLPDNSLSGIQGWFMNTRRPKFFDRRVREAINLLFDFEWTNKNLMYESYTRTTSFFQNSDMMATGLPSPAELKLLEPFRGQVPEEVFGEPWSPPDSDGSGEDRELRRRAMALLKEAGYAVEKGRQVDARGEPLTIEFLDDEGSLERHTARFIGHLKKAGIEASFRVVDPAQFQLRMQNFDFDVVVRRYTMAPYPGDELRAYFGTEAARARGSFNLAGIADPAVDTLIAAAIAASNRADLVTACRALDRVLRAGRYWVPQWFKDSHRVAYWDVFDRPAVKPRYERGVLDTWWSKPATPPMGG